MNNVNGSLQSRPAPLDAGPPEEHNIEDEERAVGAYDDSNEDDREMEDESPHRRLPPYQEPSPEEQDILNSLSDTLDVESRGATFTCGGKIPMVLTPNRDEAGNLTPRTNAKVHEQRVTTKPITIRWGADGMGRLISFPGHGEETLQRLVSDCQPVTFGRGGKDVYDESYRRAGAMSTESFMTDFCPYEAGIMDVVTQMLVPDISCDLDPSESPPKRIVTAAEERKIRRAFSFYSTRDESAISVTLIAKALEMLKLPLPDRYKQSWTWTDFHTHVQQCILRRKMEKADKWRADSAGKTVFRGLRAELYKLNVYSGPSGMFKKHVDTPRSREQIGSLVVCLPVAFEGGGLAVRHQSHEVLYDWTNSTLSDESAIHWAAFYSDIEHEVLPVTSGDRITLTYNLFLSPGTGLLTSSKPLSLNPENLSLRNQLTKILSSEKFMPKGGYLGFHLAHSYPHTHPQKHELVPKMLKGIDMAVYISLFAANLQTILTPYPFTNMTYLLKDRTVENLLEAIDIDFHADYENEIDSDYFDSDSEYAYPHRWEEEREVKKRKRIQGNVVWLNSEHGAGREMRKVSLTYGNQAELLVKYSSAAIVVRIPTWEERNGKSEGGEDGGGGY